MSDKIEREIEEVLSNIEDFDWHRRQRQRRNGPIRRSLRSFRDRLGDAIGHRLAALTAGHLMLAGFLLLIIGLVLRIRGVGLWFLLAGIVIFLIAIFWTSRGGRAPTRPRGAFWRDRYVSYEESPGGGLRRWVRRPRR